MLQVNRSQEEALMAVKETLSEQARTAEVIADMRAIAIDRFRPQRPFAPLRRHRMYTQAAWPAIARASGRLVERQVQAQHSGLRGIGHLAYLLFALPISSSEFFVPP